MKILFYVLIVSAIVLLIRFIDRIGTTKRLSLHQEEWNSRKEFLEDAGVSRDQIMMSYIHYLEELDAKRHWFFGACYPRL